MLKTVLGVKSAPSALCLLAALVAIGCGGDTSDPGDDAPADDSSDDSTADDSTADDSATDDSTTPVGNEFCSQTPVPNANITTFMADTYTVGASIGADRWGHAQSLTGEAFQYFGAEGTIDREQTEQGLRVFGTTDEGSYAGFGISFGPCSDASAYSGVEFTIQGTLGETGELQVQVQMAKTYPLEGDRGACMFADDATKWEECTNNAFNTEGTNPDEPTVIQIPWDQFTGGKGAAETIDGLDPKELLGIQFQLNCAEICEYDFTLSNLKFLP